MKSWLKNKCGPGQPPEPHRLADILFAPFHARGMGEFIFHSRSKEHVRRCTRQIAIREASFANQPAALRLASGQSCRVWRTL